MEHSLGMLMQGSNTPTHPSHPSAAVFWFHTACVFQEKLNQNKSGQEFSWQATGTQCDVASKGEIPTNGETKIAPPARCDSLRPKMSHL